MTSVKKYDELMTKEEPPELKRLRLFLEKADRIYNDLGDLIGDLDMIYIDAKSALEEPPNDFLSPRVQGLPKKT